MTTDLTRALDIADAAGRAAGHHYARTADHDVFIEPLPPGVTERYAGTVDSAWRAGFDAGIEIWVNHRNAQRAEAAAPFAPYDLAALKVCFDTYDELQPTAAELAEQAEAIGDDAERQRAYDQGLCAYEAEARALLDETMTALRGPERRERVHYTELVPGDIVTDEETLFRVIVRGEDTQSSRAVQWVSTEAATTPSNQLRPFVNEIGDSWRMQHREDLAYTYRITHQNPLT